MRRPQPPLSRRWPQPPLRITFTAGCGGQEVEVTGEAKSAEAVSGEITIEFFDAADADAESLAQITLAELGPFDERVQGRLAYRDKINKISKPVIAAVSGFALGGGCELAMSCDIIVASETARFGQPEVNLAIIPGSGGTQRLTHLIGKHRAMELVLTGDIIGAAEAERIGLVNRVIPVELMLEEAKNIAKKIAAKPVLAIKAAKEAVLKAANTALDEGLDFERKSFYMLLASEDRKEGMKAFLEKRKPQYKGR